MAAVYLGHITLDNSDASLKVKGPEGMSIETFSKHLSTMQQCENSIPYELFSKSDEELKKLAAVCNIVEPYGKAIDIVDCIRNLKKGIRPVYYSHVFRHLFERGTKEDIVLLHKNGLVLEDWMLQHAFEYHNQDLIVYFHKCGFELSSYYYVCSFRTDMSDESTLWNVKYLYEHGVPIHDWVPDLALGFGNFKTYEFALSHDATKASPPQQVLLRVIHRGTECLETFKAIVAYIPCWKINFAELIEECEARHAFEYVNYLKSLHVSR